MNDICINRHKGNSESKVANKKVKKEIDRQEVYHIIGEKGCSYSKEIARLMNKQLNQISGRISELKEMNLIEPDVIFGMEYLKEGCKVYRIKDNQLRLI